MIHRVQSGDRFSSIAAAYGVAPRALLAANPQKDRVRTLGGAEVFASLELGEAIAVPGVLGEWKLGDQCGAHAHIGYGSQCYCDPGYDWAGPTGTECVTLTKKCKTGSDCPKGQPCINGGCGCSSNADCPAATPVCLANDGQCIPNEPPGVTCPAGWQYDAVNATCSDGSTVLPPTVNGWNIGDACGANAHLTRSADKPLDYQCACDAGTTWVDPTGASTDCIFVSSSAPSHTSKSISRAPAAGDSLSPTYVTWPNFAGSDNGKSACESAGGTFDASSSGVYSCDLSPVIHPPRPSWLVFGISVAGALAVGAGLMHVSMKKEKR